MPEQESCLSMYKALYDIYKGARFVPIGFQHTVERSDH